MKIALICGGNLWFLPFLNNYTSILEDANIDYTIISWNRDGSDPNIGIQYNKKSDLTKSKISKLFDFIGFCSFVKGVLKNGEFDKLIVFNPQFALFINQTLRSKYKGRYIMDFRDLSIEQKPILDNIFSSILGNSWTNVISSPGFINCLKGKHDFIINHNFNCSKELMEDLDNMVEWESAPINVLTIGGIRDFESNSQIIKALSNRKGFKLSFVGKGYAAKPLEDFAKQIGCNNITFEGFYPKTMEKSYILGTTWMNIFYPRRKSHDTALSNRFYSSLIFKRPMIVTANTVQGNYVEEYNLGLAVVNTDNLEEKIKNWMDMNCFEEYCERANSLLATFLEDQKVFKDKILEFCKI